MTLLLGYTAAAQKKSQPAVQKKSQTSFKIAVQFTSIGTGVPDEAPVLKYVQNFKQRYRIGAIAYYKVGPLGREGEYDMAFKLAELKAGQQKLFITGLKKVVNSMKGRGNATLVSNYRLNKDALPSRASVEKIEI